MNSTDKAELQVAEEQDGGAVVTLPHEEGEAPAPVQKAESDVAEPAATDDDAGDEVAARAGETEDEREAIRAARREERRLKKQIHRTKERESNHLITALRKQNNELAERLAKLETRTSGAEMARIDKVIDDTGVSVEYAKMKIKEAMTAQDGDAMVRAQQLLYENQRKLESLTSMREQAVKQLSAPKQNIQVPDHTVQVMAAEWMKRNVWYDPNARDVDSRVAKTIDTALAEEGYDPATQEYWDELDSRVSKYLPHRAAAQDDDEPAHRQMSSRDRPQMTGTGRSTQTTARGTEFRLSPERVRALKDSGNWDDIAKRNKMIRKFAEYDRQNKGA